MTAFLIFVACISVAAGVFGYILVKAAANAQDWEDDGK